MKSHKEVEVTEQKSCDYCGNSAKYDGKTVVGMWAYMCKSCFKMFGVGLGLGKGQKLIQRKGGIE